MFWKFFDFRIIAFNDVLVYFLCLSSKPLVFFRVNVGIWRENFKK